MDDGTVGTGLGQVWQPPVTQRGRTGRLVRLLLVIGLAVGGFMQLGQPVARDVGALLNDLSAGTVQSVTIEAPGQPTSSTYSGLTVSWTTRASWASWAPFTVLSGPAAWLEHSRSSTATYPYSNSDGVTDDGAAVIREAAAAAGVPVVEQPYSEPVGGSSWSPLGFGMLAALILLIAAPQPRLATKWAWFWIAGANPLMIAFLLLEPVPLWRTEPAPPATRRLTGGWAFLISLVLTPMLRAAFPGLTA